MTAVILGQLSVRATRWYTLVQSSVNHLDVMQAGARVTVMKRDLTEITVEKRNMTLIINAVAQLEVNNNHISQLSLMIVERHSLTAVLVTVNNILT